MKSRAKQLQESLVAFSHSVRFRLVLWFVLILAVVMVAFSGFIYWRQAQDVHANAVGRLNTMLEHLLGSEHEREGLVEQVPVTGGVIPGATPIFGSDSQAGEVIAIQGPDGTIQQSTGVLTAAQIQALQLPTEGWSGARQVRLANIAGLENRRYLFVDPAFYQNGQVAGYFLLGVPLDPDNQLGRLVASLVFGNLLTLAIALTGGFWLADRAMRPVHTITQAARQISESDLSNRLHLPGRDELAELANTFDAMLERLQAAFERQRQFTADASHELRTPLTIINLEASRALSTRRSVEEYDRALSTIQAENHFMTRLVNNLLSLARMDAGQVKLKAEPLDLGDLVSEVVERMAPLATTQGVALNVGELPEITISGDRATLTQMLTNLVENAIKFSSTIPSPQVHISVGKREEAGRALAWVQVRDNGIGINPEHQAHIFDRFYQVDGARSRADGTESRGDEQASSGTGLGLAIAHWIAQAHQGEIRVESTLGQGSTFEVMLPANDRS